MQFISEYLKQNRNLNRQKLLTTAVRIPKIARNPTILRKKRKKRMNPMVQKSLKKNLLRRKCLKFIAKKCWD